MPCPKDDILCQSGDLFLPYWFRRKLEYYIVGSDTSIFYVTFWSIIHCISGIFVAYFNVSYWNGFLIHTVWEMYQILVKNTPFNTLRGKIDIITDTIFFMIGMILYKNGFEKLNSLNRKNGESSN